MFNLCTYDVFQLFFQAHRFIHVRVYGTIVNSEIFARVLFSRNFAFAKYRENKIPRKMAKPLCRLLISLNHALVTNFSVANMLFDAIC